MSEYDDNHSEEVPEADFIHIIEASETRDAGIVLFEQSMREQETYLAKKYFGRNDTNFQEIDETQSELDEKWMFYGRVARVSGRIYLTDDASEDVIPTSWGVKSIDDHSGKAYYFLENVALRSHGVEVVPILGENMNVERIRIGYVFSRDDEDGDKGDPVFVGYPGELAQHSYETPTPVEAELRLRRKWPKQFNTIRYLVKPQLQAALPRRVQKLERAVYDELVASKEFRALLEIYLDEQLAFDQTSPYFVTTTDRMFVYDGHNGENPHTGDDEHGSWLSVTLAHPLTVLAYRPLIKTYFDEHGVAHLNIAAEIFNSTDASEPEYVRFVPNHMHHFRSTRAQQSILDRVLGGVSLAEDGNSDIFTRVDRVVGQLDLASIEGGVTAEKLPESPYSDEVQAMIMLENELIEVKRIVQQAKKIVYPTQIDAHKASLELTRTIANRLFGAGLGNKYRIVFSGGGVMLPSATTDTMRVKDQPDFSFSYAMNHGAGLKELDNGDDVDGIIETVTGATQRSYDDITNEIDGHVVHPLVVASISTLTKSLFPWNGLSLSDVQLTTRAVVALDGSAELKIVELQQSRRISESMQKAADQYGDTPIMSRFKKIQQIFETELRTSYTPFEHIDLLTGINQSIERLLLDGKSQVHAVELLEALIVDRLIVVSGDLLRLSGEKISEEEFSAVHESIMVRVIDVINNNPSHGVTMIVQHASFGLISIPIRSIKEFKF